MYSYIQGMIKAICAGLVPDHESQDSNVVLVRRTINLGKPRGLRNWNGEGMGRGWGACGQFMSNLRSRWTGSHQAKGGIPSK
jgi:hypothetical protein